MRQALSGSANWLGWQQAPLTSVSTAIVTTISFGIVFGWLEAVQHFVFSHEPAVLTIHKVSPGVFWTAPLLTAVLTATVALIGATPRWWFPGWPSVGIAVLTSGWLGTYGLATLTNKMHKGAAAILALGVAVAIWRVMRRPEVLQFVRRTTPALLGAVILVSSGLWIKDTVDGRRWVAELPASAQGAPNILVIVMDTVRADHLSLDGYPRQTTPNIDRWVLQGVVFDNAWSTSSWTLPAHASLLTGRPADEHGADHGSRLDSRLLLLPELLTRHGYVTGAFIANNIWINPEYGFDRGFQAFSVHTPYSDASRTVWGRKIFGGLRDWLDVERLPDRKDAAAVNTNLLKWLDEYRGRPFFALVNYFDVHDPYHPPPPFDTRFTGDVSDLSGKKRRYRDSINAYDGLLAYVDEQIGFLRHELEQRDLARNTVVIITSDHGEALGDQGQPQHGKTLHRAVLRVPLVLVGPGAGPPGTRIRRAVSIEALPATVAALVGLDRERPFPGRTLIPPTDGDGDDVPVPVLAELKDVDGSIAAKSLITAQWQYIWNAPDGREELYDLDRDPRQLENLATAPGAREVRLEFRRLLRARFPDLQVPVP